MEYWDPINLMDHPSKMKINLCWYKKQPTISELINDLRDDFMVDLETIIALTSMTCIVHFRCLWFTSKG